MKVLMVLLSAQTTYVGKVLFLNCDPETSRPIRIQNFLSNNISETLRGINLNFCIEEISIKSDVEKMKVIKYQNLLFRYIIISFLSILWP